MLQKLCVALLAVIGIFLSLSTSGCRTDSPPPIDIGLGDGFGGGDFVLREGSRLRDVCKFHDDEKGKGWYCPPSALINIFMTTSEDMERHVNWCYDISSKKSRALIKKVKESVRK